MELVPRTARLIGTAAPSEPASPTAVPRSYIVRSKATTLADLLPLMKKHHLKELQDTVLEACLAYQLEEHRKAEGQDGEALDWTLPIKRRLNKYPAGRMHKAYSALLAAGHEQIDYFAKTMAGLA